MNTLDDYIKACEKLIRPPREAVIEATVEGRISIRGTYMGQSFTSLVSLQFFNGGTCIASVIVIEVGGLITSCVEESAKEHLVLEDGRAPTASSAAAYDAHDFEVVSHVGDDVQPHGFELL